MTIPWKHVVPALLVGALLGAWASFGLRRAAVFHPKEGRGMEKILKKFSKELSLDLQQQAQVKTLLEDYRGRLKTEHQQRSARFEELHASLRQDIEKVLTEEQKPRFKTLLERWEARRKKRFHAAP